MERKKAGMLAAIASAILFGTMPIATKIAFAYGANSYMASFGRFFWASVSLFIIIKTTSKYTLLLEKRKLMAILRLSFFNAFTPVFLYLSYHYIGAGMATSLHFTYPITVVLILFLFYKERITKTQLICLGLCVLGIAMLYVSDGTSSIFGMTVALLSGVVYSVYIVLLRKSHLEDVPLMVLTFWVTLFAAIEVLLFNALTGQLQMIWDWHIVGAEMYLGIFATALAFILFQKGTFDCGAVQTSLLSTFEPVTGVAIGLLLYGEVLTARKGLGIAAIIGSSILLVMAPKKEQ